MQRCAHDGGGAGRLLATRPDGGEAESLDALRSSIRVDKSLLSDHLRGGRDSNGLEALGLVAVDRSRYGKTRIRLTELGRVILSGRFLEGNRAPGEESAAT